MTPRIAAVGTHVHGDLVLLTVRSWGAKLRVRAFVEGPCVQRPSPVHDVILAVLDDIGTRFDLSGASGTAATGPATELSWEFDPGLPAEATRVDLSFTYLSETTTVSVSM